MRLANLGIQSFSHFGRARLDDGVKGPDSGINTFLGCPGIFEFSFSKRCSVDIGIRPINGDALEDLWTHAQHALARLPRFQTATHVDRSNPAVGDFHGKPGTLYTSLLGQSELRQLRV